MDKRFCFISRYQTAGMKLEDAVYESGKIDGKDCGPSTIVCEVETLPDGRTKLTEITTLQREHANVILKQHAEARREWRKIIGAE